MTADQLLASRALAITAAQAAADKQASDILILEVREQIALTDHFVIASGATNRQVKAIADAIEDALREAGHKPMRREGERDARWVLLDFIDIVVHVFLAEERAFYELERLWSDAPTLAWAPTEQSAVPS